MLDGCSEQRHYPNSCMHFPPGDQRNRLEAILRDHPLSLSELCGAADVALFNRIVTNVHHPLQGFLPPRLSRPYNMRPREHEFQLPDKQIPIHEKNFLICIFYLVVVVVVEFTLLTSILS